MKNRKRISMLVMSSLLVGMLAFSVSAAVASANATSTGAAASVTSNTGRKSISLSASIWNDSSEVEDNFSGTDEDKWVAVQDGDLTPGSGAATGSFAYASCDGVSDYDSWY